MKRILVAVSLAVLASPVFALQSSAPFDEQSQVDGVLPSFEVRNEQASAGSTGTQGSVWANDYNFVAPAQ